TYYSACHSFPTRRSSDLKNSSTKVSISIVVIPGLIIFAISLWHFTRISAAFCICSISRLLFLVIIFASSFLFLYSSISLCDQRSEEHTSELQSRFDLVCRLLLEKKNTHIIQD